MNRNVTYRVWPRAVPDALCHLLKAMGDDLTAIKATLYTGEQQQGVLDETKRKTSVGFWDETHWVNGLLMHYVALANRQTWQFDLSFIAGVQYATYDGGGFFDWHKDEFDMPFGPLAPTHHIGLNRKLTAVLNLTDSDAYAGGDVLLKDAWGNTLTPEGMREKGSVVVFPAYIVHTVTPVTSGLRNSLVGWVLGPSFR